MSLEKIKTVTLADVSINNKGEYGIGASAVDYSDELYTYLRITDINDDGTLNKNDLKSVDDVDAKNYLLNENDVVFARTGNSTGKAYYYDKMDGELVYAGFLIKFSLDSSKINPKFMKYYVLSKDYKGWVNSMCTGSTRPNINAKMYGNMELILPPREQQDFLVNILGEIDNKIEINKMINKNLEKTLITIFNSWFINFENYDNSKGMKIDDSYGEIPVDWSVEMLEDYVDFVTGVEPGSKNYHEKPEPNDIPFLRVGDLGSRDNGVFIDPSLSKNKILKYDDIVLSLDATIGIVKMGLEGAYSTGMRKLVIKNDNINQPFLYCLVKSNRIQRIIETFATGTTILHAGKSIKHMNFVLSDKKTMDDFGKIGNPIISIILTNLKEIEYLTNLRDTLLPKLMSGEIDVSEVNCDLELKYNYMKYLFNQIHTPMSKSVV
ncbi:restriction endonuclease subunit S [Methanobrevibacter smithii]|uniref:restriction endonuclease subunit S n=1 Tax=Methanobrevibacter smithii TaxID=2173 RepID=UPI0037DDB4C9